MTASPAKLATVPPYEPTRPVTRSKTVLRRSLSSSAPYGPAAASEALIGVKPAMSANRTAVFARLTNGGLSSRSVSSWRA